MKKRNAQTKIKKSSGRAKKSGRRTIKRTNSYTQRELKLSREIEDDLIQIYLDEELENELSQRPREIKKRARSSDRKNADDLTEKSKKHSKRKIKSKTHVVHSISDGISRSVIEFSIKLARRDQWDLFDIINQDEEELFKMLWPYFLLLLNKVRKKSQFFRIAIVWSDENNELDKVSTALYEFDDIPDVIKSQLLYLIRLLIRKSSEYKKHYSAFKLNKVELWRYDDLPKKKKRK